MITLVSAVWIMFAQWDYLLYIIWLPHCTVVLMKCVWGIRHYVGSAHGFCIVGFTAKWEKTDSHCWEQPHRLYLLHSSFFYVPALNIINKRGAVGIVAGSGCVMANRYLVRFGFHKWKIQADLINVQEGCMTSGLYCSHNTRQIHSAASVEVNLWTQMKIVT